jgi:uncharacterized BrkB/YihY/UPF0761 family membrane protein
LSEIYCQQGARQPGDIISYRRARSSRNQRATSSESATIGAAIAFYTMFSLAPMLVIVIAVAGFVFGQEAAEGALFGELAKLVGPDSAGAVQAMLRSASSTRSGIIATVVGIGTLIATATAVFSELQAALNLIWKVPATGNLGVGHFLKSRFLSLCVILVIGFLLLVSSLLAPPWRRSAAILVELYRTCRSSSTSYTTRSHLASRPCSSR